MTTQDPGQQMAIAIQMTPDIARLLSDNEIDLFAELRREGLDIERGPAALGADGSVVAGEKSVALTILASAAAAPLVSSAITRIIDSLSRAAKVTDVTDPVARKRAESTYKTVIGFLGLKIELSEKHSTSR